MDINTGLFTVAVEAKVAAWMAMMLKDRTFKEYVVVRLAHYPFGKAGRSVEVRRFTVNVRLANHPNPELVSQFADGSEIVRCVTEQGWPIDFIFGNPENNEREVKPASVLMAHKHLVLLERDETGDDIA